MSEVDNSRRNYVGYEYKEMQIDSSRASMYIDCMNNFGWNIDGNQGDIKSNGKVIVRLKRHRKIINRTELTRLQRNFEDCMNQIQILEQSKEKKATTVSIAIGIIGTIFIAGATFAATVPSPRIWLCVLLAIPGFVGWILPYFCFNSTVKKRTRIIEPLIEDKYDEIYDICEKGNNLLGRNEKEKESNHLL